MAMEMAPLDHNSETYSVGETWDKVKGLRLQLHDGVYSYSHEYRGQPWLILADQGSERYFRSSARAEAFINRLDGQSSAGDIYEELQQSPSSALSKSDVILLIANLKSSKLLKEDQSTSNLTREIPDSRAKRFIKALSRPFSIRFRLVDPDRFLALAIPYLGWARSRVLTWLWLFFVLYALVACWMRWDELVDYGAARFSDPVYLLYFWLIYPLVKALHEMAHALATKCWGGVVHDMGIMLLVFFPVPYVDSSAANRFASRRKRIIVGAAGIMVETFLASIALIWWMSGAEGVGRDIAFAVMVIGGISTVLFNANPLLRFDGYYVFSEWIQIPNLSTRSQQYLGYLVKRYAVGMGDARSPVTAVGETKWLFVYGVAAAVYRIFISLFIALWVSGKFFVLGVTLALWAIISQMLYPAVKNASALYVSAQRANLQRRLAVVTAFFATAVVLILSVPVPDTTYAQGLVNIPEDAAIRAASSGIVREVHGQDGRQVEAGGKILTLSNIELEAQRGVVEARIDELRGKLNQALSRDRYQAEIVKNRISNLEEELSDINNQIAGLSISSHRSGQLVLPSAQDLQGRFIKRGDLVGYSLDPDRLTARLVIPQAKIDQVRQDTQDIRIRLSGPRQDELVARLSRETPLLSDRLPSRYLGSSAGGETPVDVRDDSGVQALTRVYQMELELAQAEGVFPGQRVHARFVHSAESLAGQMMRYLRHLWLREGA